MTLRVLHLVSNWKLTGPVAPALELAGALRERGLEVDAAVGRPIDADVTPAGDHARAIGLPLVGDLVLAKHFRLLENMRDVARLRKMIAEEGYDVLHVHGTNDHLLAAGAVKRRFAGAVVRSTYFGSLDRIKRRDSMLLRRRADAVCVASAAELAWARSQRADLGDRLLQTPGAVDLVRFDPTRVAGARTPDAFRIGIVARVQTHRRWDDILGAVEALRDLEPSVRVVVIGRGTNVEALLETPVRTRGLEAHVELAGYRTGDAYVELLAGLDAAMFLVPGSDGTCRAVRELMAMGLPTIVAETGMLPELVAGGDAGIVLDGPGPAPLSRAIRALATDRARRDALGRAARSRALATFDLAGLAERVEALYRRALAT